MNLDFLVKDPLPYETASSIWTDPHIARQMLLAHLSAETDAASYRPERRAAIVEYLYKALGLAPGARLLDLGCGPGLYAQAFARLGVRVVGVDLCENSVAYARGQADREGADIEYRVADYSRPLGILGIDAAVLISQDYGVLSPQGRSAVLAGVRAALKPGGLFALDVTADAAWPAKAREATWSAHRLGFWRPHPYALLEKKVLYPQERAWCDFYAVWDGEWTAYHVFQTAFTPERIARELKAAGFEAAATLGSLDGAPYRPDGAQIGIVARRT